jgi:biopolymer transport protein ExbD
LNKGGLLIRLIDVAMIILFGFIAISDIKVRAQIKLPSDKIEQESTEQAEPALIFVRIGLNNLVTVTDNDELEEQLPIDRLEERLLQLRSDFNASGREIVVLIEPHEDSIMQHTIDVLDICERHTIPKNINYESMQF